MRIQKYHAVICLAALVGAVSFNVKADDTEAQARARELLRQKMAELDGQSPGKPSTTAPAPAPMPAAQPKPMPTPTPAPAPAPAATVTASGNQMSPGDVEKARAQ